MERLTLETLDRACRRLATRDRDLAHVLEHWGRPPLWQREPGFPTLVHIILEQQVSLASARAAFLKLRDRLDPLEPASFLSLGDTALKQIGFSRQKTRYCRALATTILDGGLDLEGLARESNESVRNRLMRVTGIGRWTSDIYLLMVLLRPDIWPMGDLALATAALEVKKLSKRPTYPELADLALAWKPWRAAAARILWHHYLSSRGQT